MRKINKATQIATSGTIITIGDIIYHAGQDKKGRIGIEELKVTGFQYERSQHVVFKYKPKLQSLHQFWWNSDKKIISTQAISMCFGRGWFFYNKHDALTRIKLYIKMIFGITTECWSVKHDHTNRHSNYFYRTLCVQVF